MAVRPMQDFKYALVKTFTCTSVISVNRAVKFGSNDYEVVPCAANDPLAIGVAIEAGVVGKRMQICLLGNVIVPMLVGTGGATRGKALGVVADGVTDAATLGGGTTSTAIVGRAMESGVAGDIIGVMLSSFVGVAA